MISLGFAQDWLGPETADIIDAFVLASAHDLFVADTATGLLAEANRSTEKRPLD
jgi:hypothetical protein